MALRRGCRGCGLRARGFRSLVCPQPRSPAPHVVRLTTYAGNEYGPSFSPTDAGSFFLGWREQDNWDLYVKLIGSPIALRLTTDPAGRPTPSAWSPDGRQIAYLKHGEKTAICTISPLGGPEQKIVDFDAANGAPAWSPDGKFVVVAKAYRGTQPGHGRAVPHSRTRRRATPVPAPEKDQFYLYPAFAPAGGSRRTPLAGRPAVQTLRRVYRRFERRSCPRGGEPRPVATAVRNTTGLTWTSDGRSIIYDSGSGFGPSILWRADAAGGKEPGAGGNSVTGGRPSRLRRAKAICWHSSVMSSIELFGDLKPEELPNHSSFPVRWTILRSSLRTVRTSPLSRAVAATELRYGGPTRMAPVSRSSPGPRFTMDRRGGRRTAVGSCSIR